MTVESQTSTVSYVVTNPKIGTEYPITFPYVEATDVKAYYLRVLNHSSVKTEMTINKDYTVEGRTLTTLVEIPLEGGPKLAVYRSTERSQEIVWVDGQAVYPPNVMKADDKLTFIVQELTDEVGRSIRTSVTDPEPPVSAQDLYAEINRIVDRAEDAANRAVAAASGIQYKTSFFNKRASWAVTEPIGSGGTLSLPVTYFPSRNHLLLFYNGILCEVHSASSDAAYQYTEVGTVNIFSSKVILHFDAKVGDRFDVLAVASGTPGIVSDNTVIATGTTEERTIGDRFADIVNVKDFGAIGDGVQDDSDAVEVAINSGYSLFFPNGNYIIKRPLTIKPGNSRSFHGASKMPIASEVSLLQNQSRSCPCLVFDYKASELTPMIHVKSSHIQFVNLGFYGRNEDYSKIGALKFYRQEANSDDIDGYVMGCVFVKFQEAVRCVGRCMTGLDNMFVTVTKCFVLDWPKAGTDNPVYDTIPQTPPYANRGHRIQRNRRHNYGYGGDDAALVVNIGDTLRGAIISENVIDTTGVLFYDSNSGIENTIIANNIVDIGLTAKINILGPIYNSSISGNVFSARTSYIKSADAVMAGSRYTISLGATSIRGLKITNNMLCGADDSSILLGRFDTTYNRIYENIEISSNEFHIVDTGSTYTNRGLVKLGNHVNRFIFTNNSGNVSPIESLTAAIVYQDTALISLNSVCIFSNNFADLPLTASFTPIKSVKLMDNDGSWSMGMRSYSTAALSLKCATEHGLVLSQSGAEVDQYVGFVNDNGYTRLYGLASATSPAIYGRAASGATTLLPNLGKSSRLWNNIYASSGTISTSDERSKCNIEGVSETLFRAWEKVNFYQFQFLTSVENKGQDSARLHIGLIAQHIQDVFASEGISAESYGLFCHDSWPDQYEPDVIVKQSAVYDADGGILIPEETEEVQVLVQKAGDRYSLRYDEVLALEAAYQRWRADTFEKRLAALEQLHR